MSWWQVPVYCSGMHLLQLQPYPCGQGHAVLLSGILLHEAYLPMHLQLSSYCHIRKYKRSQFLRILLRRKTMCCKVQGNIPDFLSKSVRAAGRSSEYPALPLSSEGSVPERHIFLQFRYNNGVLRMPSLLLHPRHRIYRIRLRRTALCHRYHKLP